MTITTPSHNQVPLYGGVARDRAPRDVSRGWLGRGGIPRRRRGQHLHSKLYTLHSIIVTLCVTIISLCAQRVALRAQMLLALFTSTR